MRGCFGPKHGSALLSAASSPMARARVTVCSRLTISPIETLDLISILPSPAVMTKLEVARRTKNKALRTYKSKEAYLILHYISIHEEVTATSDTAQLFTLYYKEGTLTSIDRNASLLCTKTCSEPEQVKGPHFATFARTYPALRESKQS